MTKHGFSCVYSNEGNSSFVVTNLSHESYEGFLEGIVGNLELMSIYYPGWVMRLYYDIEDGDPIIQVTSLFS